MYVSKTLQIAAEKCSSVRCASAGTTGPTFAKNTSSKQQHYFVHAVIIESLVTIFFLGYGGRVQSTKLVLTTSCFNFTTDFILIFITFCMTVEHFCFLPLSCWLSVTASH